MKAFLKLIRWPNLLMIVFLQYLIRFCITESLSIPHVLNHLEYIYGVICSISLAAAGYIINDIYDVQVDLINKPKRMVLERNISISNAWQMYFGFNLLAMFSGYAVAKASGIPSLWMLPLLAIALLYFYAIDLKKRAVIGNILVSLLTALPVFLVALYDIIPAATAENRDVVRPTVLTIAAYGLFAFWSNFIREIVKDAQDIEGDKVHGFKTLAILLGTQNIKFIIVVLSLVMLCFTAFFNYYIGINQGDIFSGIYLLLFVNLPILYFIYSIVKAQNAHDFKLSSTLIKIVMLTAILSMAVFTLSYKYFMF